MATGDISYIRSELLCFAFDRFSAKSFSDLKETISNFYGVDAVCEAKSDAYCCVQNYSTVRNVHCFLSPYRLLWNISTARSKTTRSVYL